MADLEALSQEEKKRKYLPRLAYDAARSPHEAQNP